MAARQPLALLPMYGRSLVHHALDFLCHAGAKRVTVLAVDRPAAVREALGKGEEWGIQVQVLAQPRELEPAEARVQVALPGEPFLPAPWDVLVLDHLPQLPAHPLWRSHRGFSAALRALLPEWTNRRVGAREVAPGVWAGLRTRVAPNAELRGPCWLGAHVWIGPRAVVGPDVVIEDGCYVDEGAELKDAVVGERTFVGGLTQVQGSLALGRRLINLDSGSMVDVPDPFLLSELQADDRARSSHVLGRVLALVTLVATSPLLAVAALRSRWSHQPWIMTRRAVISGPDAGREAGTVAYAELPAFKGVARRWPQLWNVVRGDFTWVGNRPLAADEAARLNNDYERLWLAAPTGLVSLADAMGCAEAFGDEARAHASYFAVDPAPHRELRVLMRLARRWLGLSSRSRPSSRLAHT